MKFTLLFLLISMPLISFADEGIPEEVTTQVEESAPAPQDAVAPVASPEVSGQMPAESELSPEEEKILKEIRDNKGAVPEANQKGINRINKKSRMVREDSRILIEHMSVGDIYEVKTCFGNPFRISFGESVTDRISEAKLGNIAKFTQDINPDTRRSILIAQKEAEAEGSVHTTLWLERASDKRAYIFNITGEPCPPKGLLKYPVEIIIENKQAFDNPHARVLLPTDFITELTKNFPKKNDANFISINGLVTSANATYSSIGVSIVLKNVTTQTKMREPRFIVTDWSKTRIIESHSEYLVYPSQAESDKNGLPTLRFNLKVKIGKKQITERKFIYLLIMYEDDKYYQIAKIPVYDMLMGLKDLGWEI